VSAAQAGAGIAGLRLRSVPSLVGLGVAFGAVLVVALLERRFSPIHAADRALSGVALGIVLPLWTYGLVARATDGQRLVNAIFDVARLGGSRRAALLGWLTLTAGVGALVGALLAIGTVLITRSPSDPRLASDLLTSSWIGLLAGFVYVCWFAAASTFGARGGGRLWALALDWVLGAGISAIALPWPRSHVRNLLGAEPVLDLPQWASTAGLLALAVLCSAIALGRSPR
jgi:hypothetical protein